MIASLADNETLAIGLQALTGSGVGWWRVLDPQTTWWSPKMFDIFGLDPASGVPTPEQIFKLYHPDDSNIVGRSWRHFFSCDDPLEIRYRIRRPDGEVRHCWNWAQRQPPDAEGRRWVVGLLADITEHLDDKALFEAERAFRYVTEHTHDMVIRYRLDGVITYVSPGCRTVLGYDMADMVGQTPSVFVPVEDMDFIRKLMADQVARKESKSARTYEFRARNKNGDLVWLEANPRLVFNGAGEPVEVVDVVRNITARKAADAELDAARADAEAAALAKSEFLANMSHELRTPLTSILGFSRVIGAGGGLSDADKKHLALVRDAGETLLAVVNDILDFSKLEAGCVDLAAEPFSIGDLAASVAALLGDQAASKGVGLTCAVDHDIPVLGDASRVRQVLLNLVGNGVKFTDRGSVAISVSLKAIIQNAVHVSVSVTDTGVGLDPLAIDRLFERFTQADGSVSRRFGGTGLGLAISRRLVELMGGTIGARCDGSSGSTFWFDLTLPSAEGVAEGANEAARPLPDRPLRLLLAEDNPANRLLVTTLLAPFGLWLDVVENGEEAVAAAKSSAYDLILMDMQMPVMDGMAATRLIRQLPGAAGQTPVIALTANVLPEQIAQCRAAGMTAHLAKPIDISALVAVISDHAGGSSLDEAAAIEPLADSSMQERLLRSPRGGFKS